QPRPRASAPSPTPARPPARLVWKDCGDGFSCSTLPVPLVESEPDGKTLDLAVVRRPATGARIGSLVVNPGGPGASAVDYLRAAYGGLPQEVRERFDLVAFDPRGVGRSDPVRCASTAELDRYFALDPTPDDAAELTAYEKGNAALARGCEARSGAVLAHVSTREAAGDLDRLRASLGDPKLTYLGYSYGTSIGAQYLDRYPTRVRAMVLDGALDPALTWDALLEGQSRGFDEALDAYLQDCQETRCPFRRAVAGDLGAAYDRLAAKVERTPLPGSGGRDVGPGEFSLGVGAGLYSRESGWPAISDALVQAEHGSGEQLLALSDSYLERGPEGYTNVSEANLAVNCLDRPWPRDAAPFTALAERVAKDSPRFGPSIALSGLACASWPVPPSGRPRRVTAPGMPPVVVIGTTRDPATPYRWAVALAGQLSHGVLLTHDGDGHTVYRAGAPDCIVDPVDTYLVTGKAPTPARC
ncbi:MAG: proteinase, partial [Frankiales bacterium]|nr:proteinase [Frankiales bacterium]